MIAKNNISPVVESTETVDGIQSTLHHTEYIEPYSSLFKPGTETVQYLGNTPKLVASYKYDNMGNTIKVLKNGIIPTSYIYGYVKTLPIAKIENATEDQVFHENFEEIGTYGFAHTGNKYNAGAYNLNFAIPDNKSYLLSYWYHQNNKWNYKVETYTTPHSILPTGADAIDDVNIYPSGAQITTYTYDLFAGLTSTTDANGNTIVYEYDEFHRLAVIRDKDRNIIKQFCYNYAGQQTDCTVPYIRSAPPAAIIYAKLTLSNTTYGQVNGYIHNYNNYSVQLYSNPQCTLPYTAVSDIQVSYRVLTTVNNTGDVYADYTPYVTVPQGSSGAITDPIDVSGCYSSSGSLSLKTGTTISSASTQKSASGVTSAQPNTVPTDPNATCVTSVVTIQPGTGYTPVQ
jgi:YD repeat-containing protein